MNADFRTGLAIMLSVASPAGPGTAPANTLSDLQRQFDSCVSVATNKAEGSELTIAFSLKRDGSLLGKPRITHSRLVGDLTAQRNFVEAAIRAVASCLPAKITRELGGAIAGRLFSIRIVNRPRETET